MAGSTLKKRSRDDTPKAKPIRPTKKQRKQALDAYHSDSNSDADADADNDEFPAVDLLDSDSDDIHNARADDGSDDDDSDSGSDAPNAKAATLARNSKSKAKANAAPSIARDAPQSKLAHDAPQSSSSDSEADNDEYSDLSASDDDDNNSDGPGATGANRAKLRAKRNDPAAFATSLSKILSTKLSTTRRADPVLARSAAAHAASRQAVDSALETKARKQLRTAKRAAMERGRVRDVLVATAAATGTGTGTFGGNVHPVTGEILEDADMAAAWGTGETAGQVLETERRLRKVAQRGVVQLFNAFRTAQVKAAEAERGVRKEGVIGVDRKKEKVTEMSKRGFLDLIASGGGGLKKAPLEEA
ncbi:unnamed protein product [Discula destructiva]